jgi:hypothetical protein
VDADTAAFAVESIRRWWRQLGKSRYPAAKRLVITADCGGSNGARVRLWKRELKRFANETGLAITVAHLPPGTSKRNRIEHDLFAHISRNWRGKPLVSHQVIVQLIGATTTQTGLTVRCELDTNRYPKGIKVTDAEMAALAIERGPFLAFDEAVGAGLRRAGRRPLVRAHGRRGGAMRLREGPSG